MVQPRHIGWVSSHLLKDLAMILSGMREQGHGDCRKREIERRVRQGGLYILRTLIRRFLHCWQPRRDLRCEAREGIRR
jgi:hypothetical protein